MNIHHLELFYYVARHGGISAAVRRIPYGIQQPAVSWQILQLEKHLDTVLFVRRPFALTASGARLFAHIAPFFEGLAAVETELRQGSAGTLRIGTIEKVQRDYLPGVLRALRERFPRLSFGLVNARLPRIEELLLEQKLDLGVAALTGRRTPGIHARELLRLQPGLWVSEETPWKSAEAFFARERIEETLIAQSSEDPFQRLFLDELARRGIPWFCGLEVQSQDLVGRYVAEGFGVGLAFREPLAVVPAGCRWLPLEGFPKLSYGVVWTGELSALQKAFIEECSRLVAVSESASEAPESRPRSEAPKKRGARAPGVPAGAGKKRKGRAGG
ncbi:MAG: hypothetical protein RLZZ244_1652 [Verrucomicrobiota bacterium]